MQRTVVYLHINLYEKYNKISSKMYKHLVQQKVQEGVHNDFVALFIKLFMFNKVRNSQVTKSSYAKWRHVRVTNSKICTEILLSKGKLLFYHFWVTNSRLENKVSLSVTKSKLKNKKFHFALLTRSWKRELLTPSS